MWWTMSINLGKLKIKKIRGDVQVKQCVLFTSLDKCCGDGLICLFSCHFLYATENPTLEDHSNKSTNNVRTPI